MSTFRDHFGAAAAGYATYRPRYPAELFAWLASQCRGLEMAWDVGTGSGQAAVALAEHFTRVLATDASAVQLEQAERHPRVVYGVAEAGRALVPPGSVDLVTVAQAVHWFDLDTFWPEVQRALRPGGVVAIWSYPLTRISPEIDSIVDGLYHGILGPWWLPERQVVDSGYATIPFPFDEMRVPQFVMDVEWTVDQFEGYLGTWSAVLRFREGTGTEALDQVRGALREAWGAGARRVIWPLALRVGRS